ncbi:MAG: hypothetical protein ABIO02_00175 [Patescibacteria group bacterium]
MNFSEGTPRPQPERLIRGQNFYDQPVFARLNELGREMNIEAGIHTITYSAAQHIVNEMAKQPDDEGEKIDFLELLEQPDIKRRYDESFKTYIGMENAVHLRKVGTMQLKSVPAYQVAPDKYQYMKSFIPTVLSRLDEPFFNLYYIYSHRFYYQPTGEQLPNLLLPQHFPLLFDQWKNHIAPNKDIGLGEVLQELGYAKSDSIPGKTSWDQIRSANLDGRPKVDK